MAVMRLTRWVILAVAILLAVGLACTGSDVLHPTISEVAIVAAPQNVDTERFEIATIGVVQIQLRPVAAQADANIGANDLGLLPNPVTVDMTQSGPVPVQTTRLSPGQYRVTEVRLLMPVLKDTDPPAVPATCIENFAEFPGPGVPAIQSSASVDFRSTPDPPILTFGASGAVELTLDVRGIIDLFQSSFSCSSTRNCRGPFGETIPPPCIQTFFEDDYNAGLPALVGFGP